jgi:NCAIR mutase (PurE)-related protein
VEEKRIRELLETIKNGNISEDEAIAKLKNLPYENLDFAMVDHHRALRTGIPEVIFSQGKTFEQVRDIAEKLHHNNRVVLATRATGDLYDYLLNSFDSITYNRHARIIIIGEIPPPVTDKYILVLTGGTSDIPFAEEAALSAEAMGSPVKRLFDVGITGVHRVLSHLDILTGANVIVAAAGMEGALPTLAAGLVSRPVIALPTSVGYGANFQGLSALLTMLNSCAPGVAVVNIDNGFGAGYLASIINLG